MPGHIVLEFEKEGDLKIPRLRQLFLSEIARYKKK